MISPVSVSTLNEQIKNLLESTFVRVYVEGELSRITYHNSGHIYFTLKDAGSSVRCVMFRGNASKLRFRLEEGLKVLIDGAITLYKPRGEYQINVHMVEPAGHGALALAYEQLKQRLGEKGYFAPERKKALPKMPKRIALITSATGAALQDMLHVSEQRWPLARLYLYDVLVQGENAAPSIAAALRTADSAGYDAIVVGRGGGSIEDLWAFNEEIVADAIYACMTPVVSAVGHEIDWVISDFVADLRAPTPSAAMQMLLPDQNEMLLTIDALMGQYDATMRQKFHRFGEQVSALRQAYGRHSIEQKLALQLSEITQLKARFSQTLSFKLESMQRELLPLQQQFDQRHEAIMRTKRSELVQLQEALKLQDPKRKTKKGYAQLSRNGKVIALGDLKEGEHFDAMDDTRRVTALVEKITAF